MSSVPRYERDYHESRACIAYAPAGRYVHEKDYEALLSRHGAHNAGIARLLSDLAEYLGLTEDPVNVAAFVPAAERIRQWCADAQSRITALTVANEQLQRELAGCPFHTAPVPVS